MTDPYRTPGEVETDEERRRRWATELQGLMICDWRTWTPEQKQKGQARVDELRRLLTPPVALVQMD